MNLKYIGDALDHWKGSLFEGLQLSGVLRSLAVDPMATDGSEWRPADRRLFARLLRIPVSALIRHRALLTDRGRYFEEIQHPGDLFLDPDTGIATGRVTPQHVRPDEVVRLLEQRPGRVIAVYQHVRAQRVRDRVAEVCKAVSRHGACHWASYESGTVAMLFFSRDRRRVLRIAAYFRRQLGEHAVNRVFASTRS